MTDRNKPHLIVPTAPFAEPFTGVSGGHAAQREPLSGDRGEHGRRLQQELGTALAPIGADEEDYGVTITFVSFPGLELALQSLDPQGPGSKPELLAVKSETTTGGDVQMATVYVPAGAKHYFLRRLTKYVESVADDRPQYAVLVEGIASIRRATIRELWTDPDRLFPDDNQCRQWWEVWLRNRDGTELQRLRALAQGSGLPMGRHFLGFGDRTVALLQATVDELSQMFESLDDLAELRWPREIADVLVDMSASEQVQWVDELLSRTRVADMDAPVVCVLDTGVQDGHPLLVDSLHPSDIHVAEPTWNKRPILRHGTEMAGLALFEDLHQAVLSPHDVYLRHRLESVKFLPDNGSNHPDLYGAVTAKSVDRPEIQAPRRDRAFLLAVTAQSPTRDAGTDQSAREEAGRPTSWSAAVDALAYGRTISDTEPGLTYLDRSDLGRSRLFIISAGNIRDIVVSDDHLDRSDFEPAEDPAQAWNALTVGAYTDKDDMSGAPTVFDGYAPLAPRGELAPTSRTSVPFDPSKWPFKPEVVAEGGNVAVSPHDDAGQTPECLGVLTTRLQENGQRAFTTTRDTSAATAQVASIAGAIMAEYPGIRAETVRALIVHSAEWTSTMKRQFDAAPTKTRKAKLQRRYGMGVPSRIRALRSATDALTLVSESSIRPFERDNNATAGKAREMNLHRLPWPRDELEALGEAQVTMRVTLSYFIEPNPSSRGWSGRYAYPSYGLRFMVRRPEDNLTAFRQRINLRARVNDEKPVGLASEQGWLFGVQQRGPGSLQTDLWTGTAVELANKGDIAVFPVAGWWKDRPRYDQSQLGVHYSLVVGIESPAVDVDLWTPVAQQIATEVAVQT
ncbi:S8 family peptidase [Nocardia sp. NPDC050799]|uniref:S8 family peptidase n=1 Tax=Nocardia sp. NPDC050799 TaxID=3154842 RepID=UPI0033D4A3CD